MTHKGEASLGRETSGTTSRLVLAFVEREGGRAAVDAALAHAGLAAREATLRDEHAWFSRADKLALFAAAEAVLGDDRVAERIGRAALDLQIGVGVKRVLRALGSPRTIYRHVGGAAAKLNRAHRTTVTQLGATDAVVVYEDVDGGGISRHECLYTAGLLACPPALFGLPHARVEHTACALRGAAACTYHVHWSADASRSARAAPLVTGAAALAGGIGLTDVAAAAEPVAVVLALAAAGLGIREMRHAARRLTAAARRASEHEEAAERFASCLRDLSADLRPDEVLVKIARNAQAAIGGEQYAVLVDRGGMHCVSSFGVPGFSQATLEAWAADGLADLHDDALVVDDVTHVSALEPLARAPEQRLSSLCAAPLRFRGELLGVLVALAPNPGAFLPHDAELLAVYATEAAVALSNATMVERLQRLADEDALTGLANHRRFHAALAGEVARAERDAAPLSVVVVDLDHFAQVNDACGHRVGDDVLRETAAALAEDLRPYDVVARLGGQEFGVLLPGTGPREALRSSERARIAVSRVAVPGVTLTCSAGVASYPLDAREAGALLRGAQDALREAKEAGRDRTRRADPDRLDAREHAAGWAARLREALNDPDAVQVFFQPIACLRRGVIGGYEALARFPTLGLRPDVAIARAHQCGLGPELEAAAIHRALAEPDRPAGVSLTLNVSLSALGSPNLWAVLPRDLTGIVIEVTEHELYESDDRLEVNLGRLRERGARIAVDDTGSGYAGLQQLARVRPDMVKLDRALVDGVSGDPTLAALIEAFVGFAEATDAVVCAEGVEELADLRALAALRVGSAQGYGLARPAPGFIGVDPEAAAVLAEMAFDLAFIPPSIASSAAR